MWLVKKFYNIYEAAVVGMLVRVALESKHIIETKLLRLS